NILESVYKYSHQSKIFLSGSGLQFVNRELPISENDPFEARDAYSISRIQSVYAARYFRKLGLKTYVGYFFNHDSPLRSERHVNQKIVQSIKRIAAGSDEIIELGDVSVRKEFTFAGDTVEAIWRLVNNEQIFESVIGSGKAYSIADWLDSCCKYYTLDWKKFVRLVPGFVPEYKILVSDPATLQSLGWAAQVEIDELAKMMLNYK
ncbi:MAG: GDP-mannose 4,6-dehydratase, partial [Chitinophagales bacterium]